MNCDIDHAPMKLRQGKNGQFWGCANYPNCTRTMPYKENGQGSYKPKTPLDDDILKRLAARLDVVDEMNRKMDNIIAYFIDNKNEQIQKKWNQQMPSYRKSETPLPEEE